MIHLSTTDKPYRPWWSSMQLSFFYNRLLSFSHPIDWWPKIDKYLNWVCYNYFEQNKSVKVFYCSNPPSISHHHHCCGRIDCQPSKSKIDFIWAKQNQPINWKCKHRENDLYNKTTSIHFENSTCFFNSVLPIFAGWMTNWPNATKE